ncbi:MAG: NUDIX hydrolase [Planctomycetota bacterium]
MPAKLGRPTELTRTKIYNGRIFDVARAKLRFRNGKNATHELVIHQGAAVFAPIPAPGRILLIRQYRHACGGHIWEIPAGRMERGEHPLATAKRELAEECGLAAKKWRKACAFYPAPGYTTEIMHLYFAYHLHKDTTGAEKDDDEEIVMKEFSVKELDNMIKAGKIIDGKTIVAAMYLKLGFAR